MSAWNCFVKKNNVCSYRFNVISFAHAKMCVRLWKEDCLLTQWTGTVWFLLSHYSTEKAQLLPDPHIQNKQPFRRCISLYSASDTSSESENITQCCETRPTAGDLHQRFESNQAGMAAVYLRTLFHGSGWDFLFLRLINMEAQLVK